MCMIKWGRCLNGLFLLLFPSLWLMSTMCVRAVRRVGSQSCFDIWYETLPAVWQVMLFLCLTCSHSSLSCLLSAKLQPWSVSVRLYQMNWINSRFVTTVHVDFVLFLFFFKFHSIFVDFNFGQLLWSDFVLTFVLEEEQIRMPCL